MKSSGGLKGIWDDLGMYVNREKPWPWLVGRLVDFLPGGGTIQDTPMLDHIGLVYLFSLPPKTKKGKLLAEGSQRIKEPNTFRAVPFCGRS